MPNTDPNTATATPALSGAGKSIKLGLAAAIIVAIISIFLPNFYRSTARILPADTNGSSGLGGQLASAAAAFGVGISGQETGDGNFVDILASRSIKEDLLMSEFKFHAKSSRFASEQFHQETLFHYLKCKNTEQGVLALGSILSVSRDLKSKVITVSAETKSQELSQEIVKKALQGLEQFVQVKGRTRGSEKARFTDARLKESKEDLARAEDTFRRFLEGNRGFQSSADPTVRLLGTRLEAEFKLRQQLVTTLALNREQALLDEKNDLPIVNMLDDANLPIGKSRPQRASMVLLSFFAVLLASFGIQNRKWILERLFESDDDEAGSSSASNKEHV